MSCGARLAVFDIAELREVTSYDELELDTLGDRRTALFLIMSDTDDSFNFLISMCYTQLFNLLCEKADDVYGGRLPVHVRCLIDECANIGQIPKLEKLVATIRSREISACLVLQAQSQLKIATLTEDLEELRSEKNLLLVSLAYSEEDAADKFPKDIAAMEQSLKRLEEQEQKYSVELDAALTEYAGLREQAQSVDPVQLYEARQAIRPGKEQEAENRAQQVYGEKYSPLLMFDSKKAVSRILHEDIERQAVRRMVRKAQKEQQTSQKKKSKERER